jgi:hypothetical protein
MIMTTIITNASFRGFRVNVKSKVGGRRHGKLRLQTASSKTHQYKVRKEVPVREGWSASGPRISFKFPGAWPWRVIPFREIMIINSVLVSG